MRSGENPVAALKLRKAATTTATATTERNERHGNGCRSTVANGLHYAIWVSQCSKNNCLLWHQNPAICILRSRSLIRMCIRTIHTPNISYGFAQYLFVYIIDVWALNFFSSKQTRSVFIWMGKWVWAQNSIGKAHFLWVMGKNEQQRCFLLQNSW